MAICLDCIKAATGGGPPPPCDGVQVVYELAGGSTDRPTATAVVNPNSVVGYDYVFNVKRDLFTITYVGSTWVILDNAGDPVATSPVAGAGNNICPPNSGWVLTSARLFTYINLVITYNPEPSADCVNTNGAFDTNAAGWTLGGPMAWNASYSGSLRQLGTTIASATQSGILTVGDTYRVKLLYFALTNRITRCTPVQQQSAYIKISAGTKVYLSEVIDTSALNGGAEQIVVELTCEGNTNFKVEVFDQYQCWDGGGKGIYIDDICVIRISGGTPIAASPYSEIAEVPLTLNGVDYNTKLAQYQNCLAQKGTPFYNKIVGGVKCDYRELTKLKLITELLSRKDKDRALDCIYDRKAVPTATYEPIPCNVTVPFISALNPLTLPGDYTPFETFTIEAISPILGVVATRKIVNVEYDSGTGNSTVTLSSGFPGSYGGYDICLKQNSESTTTYLETFINFANRFCADCSPTLSSTSSGSGSAVSDSVGVDAEVGKSALTSETGVDITTEFNQKITI